MSFKITSPHFYDLLVILAKKDRLSGLIEHDENKVIRDANPSLFTGQENNDPLQQRQKLISLFSPTYVYDIFDNLNTDEGKRAELRSIIRNLTGFLDYLLRLVVPENKRSDVEIDLDGNNTKLHIVTNGNQSNYHIENSDPYLDFRAIGFTTSIDDNLGAKQITSLTYKDKSNQDHDLLGTDLINVRPLDEYFVSTTSSSIKNESAFLFDKAKRLFELKEHSQLGQYVPPLFFINPADINDKDIFESRLVEFNGGGGAGLPLGIK